MDRMPDEVIYRHAFREIGDYFAGKAEEMRKQGHVAVLVEESFDTVYYMPCNKEGYPNRWELKALELPRISASWLTEGEIPIVPEMTFNEITIRIDKPLLARSYGEIGYPIIFLWRGRKEGIEKLPIKKLNVKELMRVAQLAVKNREGLVIDEALKNKIYK